MIQRIAQRPEWYHPVHNEQLRAAAGADHVCEHADGIAALWRDDDTAASAQEWSDLVAGFTPAPREPSELEAATAPVDPDEAARVRDALETLDTLSDTARGWATSYRAATTQQKQAAIVDRFDDVLDGLADVLDILAGTIRAVVRQQG